ncbi:partial Acetyl-coenzyme A carboxylase carboxyl transferase subunit alpha, partial [Patescibacteria group bacterium]
AEDRGHSEAIARNLFEMAKLKTPILCTIIGEGGSGGALAIGVGDRLIMLEYSTYSVISPEGCAAILWKSPDKVQAAAEAMGITSDRIREQGFSDEVVREPLGGAHRNFQAMADSLKQALLSHLTALQQLSMDELLAQRYQRIMDFGVFEEK